MHAQLIREKEVKKKMLEMSRQAAREAHVKVDASLKNQEIIDVSVSYDGTRQKRGHTSYIGLGIIIDILSGLVLDFEVLSKYCHNCVVAGRDMEVDSAKLHIWQKGHAAMNLVILIHVQVTSMTPEVVPSLFTTTPTRGITLRGIPSIECVSLLYTAGL
ncbi:uncharacterized protein TNCV_4078971 [Trichonephila clavipes]|nr:uncharacterized protein TNCV_4078971 [Trichonephila clavipes]